jgi:beta-glucosidase
VEVSFNVTNEGDRAGTEIAQLYVDDVCTSLSAPAKTLRRFARVELDPGATQRVRFTLQAEDLALIGKDGAPVVEPGEFRVLVGGSSRDEDLIPATFTLVEH